MTYFHNYLFSAQPLQATQPRQTQRVSWHQRAAFAVFMSICSVLVFSSDAFANPLSGELSPDFTLKSRDSGNIRLSEQRGNIVILNFWASWCGPCREELPVFEDLYQDYQDMGLEILAVNVDDKVEKAKVLLQDIEVSFPVLYDTQGDVSNLYDVNAMPTTVLIDRDGKMRVLHEGYRKGDEKKYEKAIKLLMRE